MNIDNAYLYFRDFGFSVFLPRNNNAFEALRDTSDNHKFDNASLNTVYIRTLTESVIAADVQDKDILVIDGVSYKIYKKYKWRDGRFTIIEATKTL